MKNKFNKILSIVLLFSVLILALFPITSSAEVTTENNSDSVMQINQLNENGYKSYLQNNKGAVDGSQDITASFETGDRVLKFGDSISSSVNVSNDGLYLLNLSYISKDTQDISLNILIDGKTPFDEAERLIFPVFWENAEKKISKNGNEFTPEQLVFDKTVSSYAYDYSGENEFAYKFFLSVGVHEITIKVEAGEFLLEKMVFETPEEIKKYKAPDSKEKVNAEPIVIEAEDAVLKNDRALIPLSDNGSSLVHPSNAVVSKLNHIGGNNWSGPGQTIYWDIEVKKSGYYSLGFNYRQSYNVGSVSYRSLQIDGETPFEEAARIKFPYGNTWEYMTYSDEKNQPYYIYLKEGKHTISLTATGGELCELYSAMQEVTAFMGDVYVDITKVVGETVDIYRSYELFNLIPNFNENLETIVTKLESVSNQMRALQGNKTSSSVSIVDEAIRIVQKMIDKPYSAHKYKSQFYSSYTNLSSLLSDMVQMPLDIDRIVLNGMNSDNQYNSKDVSIFEKFSFSIKRFAITFSEDYDNISSADGNEALTIWINWGRDQAEALNSIIQDDFVSKYNIPVNVKLVNASLINAILAGSGPDCLIQMSRTEPVNLAMRGALVDLAEFDDFDEVIKRFHDDATAPYEYNGGTYALPVTQGFFMMFMRTDILDSLGIKTPETWDEFIAANAVLQRNNLQAVIPYTELAGSGTVNSGVGNLTLYPTLLLQKNLSLYNDEKTASALTDINQIQTFVEWTDLYTKYKFQEIANFYNRFRIGSAPLGIAGYSLYTQLKATAPEIDGRWSMTLIPGTVKEDGSVDHTSAGWGSGCSITKLSKNPENAWKFLKWWTSDKAQLKYSNMLESVLGPLGRVETANIEALSQMDWDAKMYRQITEQQKLTKEIIEIPGGYYTARGIDQAFWNVTEAGKDPTEMIKKWGAIVDNEIARKKAEYEN